MTDELKWQLGIPTAAMKMCEFLNKTYPGIWCNVRFEHVDAAGYWFSYELEQDTRRQTWCVRHIDLEG